MNSSSTIPPRWLASSLVARAGWWLLALTTITLDGYCLFRITSLITQPCSITSCMDFQITNEQLSQLKAAGIGLSFYTAMIWSVLFVSTLAWVGIGVFLHLLRPRDQVIQVISLSLITFGSTACGPLLLNAYSMSPFLYSVEGFLQVVGQIGFLFFYIFPDGRFVPSWTRWLAIIWAGAWLVSLLPQVPSLYDFSPLLFLVVVAGSVIAQVIRYRRMTSPVERQQVKWVSFSIVIAVLYFLILLAASTLPVVQASYLAQTIMNGLLYLVMAFVPISVGIAMLRYRLWNIDVIIRRTLQYGILTALLAVTYFGGVLVLQQLLRAVTGQESPAAVVVSTLLIAALSNPARVRVQSFINRRFYRRKYDSQLVLERFSSTARSEVDLDRLSMELVNAIEETLQPRQARLWLRQSIERDSRPHRNDFRNDSRTSGQ